MKILVFSDSHNHYSPMKEAIERHLALPPSERTEAVFFLGDGIGDFERIATDFPTLRTAAVLGNCDGYKMLDGGSYEKLVELGGIRFLLMHGHRHAVKRGIQAAADYAIAKCADVLLFGHTHEPFDRLIDGTSEGSVRCINPGSVGAWFGASFAVIDIRGGELFCSLGQLE